MMTSARLISAVLVGLILGNCAGDAATMLDCKEAGIAKMVSGGYIECRAK